MSNLKITKITIDIFFDILFTIERFVIRNILCSFFLIDMFFNKFNNCKCFQVNTMFMTVKDQLKQADLNDLERYFLLQMDFKWFPSRHILIIAKCFLLLSICSSFLYSMLDFGVVA